MTDIRAAVDRVLPGVLSDLTELVAIPSISSDPDRAADVQRSAEFVAAQLREVGCPEVEIVTEGGKPAVIGRFPAPEGKPTVCLYAHHDVQPTGEESQWTTEPFAATERDDRLYGRGAADDKGGIGVHLATLRAFDGKPPVGVTLFIEGEEEIGSPSLAQIFVAHGDKLACDLFVITDSGNWQVGEPAFTTSLRGMADCVVKVETLSHAVHSGQYGGVAPDALTSLCRLLATLHDDAGNVAVEGMQGTAGPDLDYPEQRLRTEAGMLEGTEFIGEGSLVSRMWTKPAISVIGLDTTSVAKASNTLIPSAQAKVAIRVAPGDNAVEALGRVATHLENHAPWGAKVTVTKLDHGEPCSLELTGPYTEAATRAFTDGFGVAPVHTGMGGSIPLAQEFRELHPEASVLITAVVDPDSRMHGIDESMNLSDFTKACHSEALLLAELAKG